MLNRHLVKGVIVGQRQTSLVPITRHQTANEADRNDENEYTLFFLLAGLEKRKVRRAMN